MESAMEPLSKILIIDDTISIINMVKTALLSENYQVLVATSGTKGIQSAILAQPDLILLDILMPEMDGYEAAEKLKENEKTQNIPIIFMSALSDTFDKVKAFQTGAVDYITKPINVDELLIRAKNHISLFRLQKQLININEYLDETVRERTEQLNQKNQELHYRNEILQATEEELKATNDELYNLIGQLEEGELKYRELTENLPDIIMTIDRNLRITYANKTLNGQKTEQIIGKKIHELDSNKNLHSKALEQINNVFEKGETIVYEQHINNFPEVFLKISLNPIKVGKKIQKILYIISDITEKKITEEALKKSQSNLSAVIENSHDSIFSVDNEYKLITINKTGIKSFKGTLGLNLKIGDNILEKVPESLTKKWKERLDKALKGEHFTVSDEYVNIDNFIYDISLNPIREGNTITGVSVFSRNVTQKRLEEKIKEAKLSLVDYAHGHTIKDVLQNFLNEAEKLTNSLIGFYHFLEDDQETITLQTWSSNTLKEMCTTKGEGLHYSVSQAGVWCDCIRERKPIVHNDYPNLPHKKGLPEGHAPVWRELVVPVIRGKKIVAVLGVGNKQSDYNKTDVHIVQEFADLTWEMFSRKIAEEKIMKEQTRATNILIGTNAGTWEWDLNTNEVKIDERWAHIIGYNQNELEPVTMETWKNSLHPDDLLKAEKLLNKHFSREVDYYDAIFRQKHKKGHWVWVNARGKVIEYTPEGKPLKMYGTHLDITEQKLAEEELRKSEERIKLLFNSSNDAIFMHEIGENKFEKFIEVNDIACERLEYSREEFLQLSPNDIDSSEPKGNRLKLENKLLEAGHGIYEAKHITKSGKVIPVEISTRVYENEGKKFALSVVRDISERKLNEKKLEDSYTKFKTLADYTYDWEYWKDINNNFIYISPSSERISGYRPEEFSENKKLFNSIIIEEDKKKWAKHENNSSNQIACESPLEFRIKTKQGKIKWINHLCRPVYDGKGNYIGNRGTNRDITVQKLSQIALTESELRFKQLADLAMEGILIHKKGVALNINKSLINITGYKEDELLGKDLIELLIPEKHKTLALSKMALKNVPPYEIEIKRNDGTLVPVELSARSFSEKDLNFRVTSFRDITEQKQMHQRILNTVIQTEEDERKRVAQELHDGLGPVLSTVKLYTQTYFRSENEKFKEKIKEQLLTGIDDALEQVSTISNNLSPHVLNDFGLKVAIQKFLEKVKKVKKINVDYIFDYLGSINSDVEITLYRVSIELINNTVKHAEATKIEISVTGNENQIILEYKDNGKGFDFDKVKIKKRGMGLFNIVNRIKSLGGEVDFIKLKEKGIKYLIQLPNK